MESIKYIQNHLGGTPGLPHELLRFSLAFWNETRVSERREHVFRVVALDAVQMEVGGVELGADLRPVRFFPAILSAPSYAQAITRDKS